ncbi:MAG: Gfo/Idh/MocA family oxidoreductase [Phycisphaeraceae bacterium]
MSNEVRIGVIGCGGMGSNHMAYFDKVPRLKFTAAADVEPKQVQNAVDKYGVKGFDDGEALMDSGLVDAVLIATPHYFHPPLSIAAFTRGIHVLTEKPVSVTAKAAQEAIEMHRKHGKDLQFAAMFQMRAIPVWNRVRQLIKDGELGEIRRTNWIVTNWLRSQRYYDSGGWRATWAGEGGGVLMNQCPHNLDLYQWLCGMPSKVHAHLGLGKYHHIEVEDDVTAVLHYPNGATGVFITTTGEAPGTNRLEIVGDHGKVVCDGSAKIEFTRTLHPVQEFSDSTPNSFPHIKCDKIIIEVDNANNGHRDITTNFVEAILDGTPLIAPAADGLHGVELANAMIMAGITGQAVDVPMDREAYDRFLKDLIKNSTFKKKQAKEAKADMTASFR